MNGFLVCPECKGQLDQSDDKLFCKICVKSFPVVDGIPIFSKTDEFYEGRWLVEEQDKSFSLKRKIGKKVNMILSIYYIRERFFIKNIRRFGKVLDLGCGSGKDFLKNKGDVYGIDISLSDLKKASNLYFSVVQGDITKLPFPDNYFDCIFSSDVLGHIPLEQKKMVFKEIYRVMKRDGFFIGTIETDSYNRISKFGKKYPQYYQKYFIELCGHRGLELPLEVIKRFNENGMEIIRLEKMYTYFWPLYRYLEILDNEYKGHSVFLKNILIPCLRTVNKRILRDLFNWFMNFLHLLTTPFFPANHAVAIKIIAKK